MPPSPAIAALCAIDADLAAAIARIGAPVLPANTREPYEALVRAIAHQQLHGRAAEAILGRMIALLPGPFPAPDALLALDAAAIRACGFSATKVATIHGLCAAALDGTIPTRAEAETLDDAALIARLTGLRGVGRWTVEMLLISTLGRPDVLPVDDFGVREGWRLLKRLPEQPRPKALALLGEGFAPYRSTLAWYLWRVADEGKKISPSPALLPDPGPGTPPPPP
jgi:DNA-3-methyladenine glycosylase II